MANAKPLHSAAQGTYPITPEGHRDGYIIFCLDEDSRDRTYRLATKKVFLNLQDAKKYASFVVATREPFVARIDEVWRA